MKPLHRLALAVSLAAITAAGLYAAFFRSPPPAPLPLAAYAPSGALLSIEAPDFAALLNDWTQSPQQKRWLTSDTYAGFSRSRLFDRLGAAQNEFATTAGLPPDLAFLHQIAGQQSLLAWYDIGKLELLYITRLPPGHAANTPLLALRDRFEQRSAGTDTFYVRTQTDADSGATRTVAFAVQGDTLLLATREDLLANALQLLQHPTDHTLLHDPFYARTLALAPKAPASLTMALDLTRLVPSPYFRTYWIQQNITAMKQFAAARSDLYRSAADLREERILIPAATPDTTPDPPPAAALAPVLSYLPTGRGVYRALAAPTPQQVLDQLTDKLLTRLPGDLRNPRSAPVADLATPNTGSDADLETRIDTPPLPTETPAAALAPLRSLLTTAAPSSMLSLSTATDPTLKTTVFTPIHTAVVLTAAAPWRAAEVQSALNAALAPHITVASAGLTWTPHHEATLTWFELNTLTDLVLAIDNTTLVLASDPATLHQLLAAHNAPAPSTLPASTTLAAGFNLHAEAPPFQNLVAQLDHHTRIPTPPSPAPNPTPPESADPATPPPFFSGNLSSLADTFRDLAAETFTQFPTPGHTTHQTVLYQWNPTP